MKRTILVFASVLFIAQLHAQELKPVNRTISVSGSASKEVQPDEIYVQVDLREYNKKNGDKIDIDQIKNNFLRACGSIGLKEEDLQVLSYSGYNDNYLWQKKNRKQNPDMKAGITYWVKVNSTGKLDELVDKMDDEATQNFVIAKTGYSKMEELKKELKIAAIKAAKEKANYLSGAIGEHVGEAVTINEPGETTIGPVPYANYAVKMAMAEANDATPVMNVDFKKIKLQFEVNVVFTLK
ncbi:MAG TPA: SIMPL domain-containing protein [Panacibacter sp.]|nr:SIMPL domain-containing protein [Panacibacter sp.]HNP44926.1 SIMPL domain-containing protein [Panacibacter sp.]